MWTVKGTITMIANGRSRLLRLRSSRALRYRVLPLITG
ncbi:transposase IS3/IS911 family protein [Ochrobactrum quorumnocens]|uniref:Transposase IS3/IS911 family protein n=1 Tax=Ochrobactrum quorumnocens TaxID=271865 RepID=A0A248UE47_9HYPH|nr:transposase IS3/IS911 family protein [[Ochrobactrum] quorumnocens]